MYQMHKMAYIFLYASLILNCVLNLYYVTLAPTETRNIVHKRFINVLYFTSLFIFAMRMRARVCGQNGIRIYFLYLNII